MESPTQIDQRRLRAVLDPEAKQESPASDRLVSDGEQHAWDYALTSMKSALRKQAGFKTITLPTAENPLIYEKQGKSFEHAITQKEADGLRATTGAEVLFRFRITDYGMTPKAWQKAYITFEVTTTLALTAIIAYSGIPAAKAAAGAYLAQETVEETAEGYAGFWALNKESRPVRIEAELVSLNPVATLWQTKHTGLADVHLSRLTRTVTPDERNDQLDQATDYASRKVVADLSGYIRSIK